MTRPTFSCPLRARALSREVSRLVFYLRHPHSPALLAGDLAGDRDPESLHRRGGGTGVLAFPFHHLDECYGLLPEALPEPLDKVLVRALAGRGGSRLDGAGLAQAVVSHGDAVLRAKHFQAEVVAPRIVPGACN